LETFVWSARYLTGEPTVDSEHQELVRVINSIGDRQANERGEIGEFQDILDGLIRYAVTHFAHEEALMASVACDARHQELHRSIHRDFAAQVEAMRELHPGPGDAQVLLQFLTDWLAYHILGVDQSMARQVQNIRHGMTPEEAYLAEDLAKADPATASLLEALNSLYRVIAQRNRGLLELNRKLEQLVEERTRDLTIANEELHREHDELKAALAAVEVTQQELVESERQRNDDAYRHMQLLLAQIVDGSPVPTLVINAEHQVTHWNKACATVTRVSAEEMVGTKRQWAAFYAKERPIMADLIVDGTMQELEALYKDKFKRSPLIEDAFEAEAFFAQFGNGGRWLYFTAAPLRNGAGTIIGAIETLQDVTARHNAEDNLRNYQSQLEELVERRTAQLEEANRLLAQDVARREATEAELLRRNADLTELNARLSEAKEQLVQSEKLASIGQLAAGVAHEINNPIGYVQSNLGALEQYLGDIFRILDAYEAAEPEIGPADTVEQLKTLRQQVDLAFLKDDIPLLMSESKEGITRVKKIVEDLKDFSRVDRAQEWQWTNLHQGIDSTVNIVASEVKYKADLFKEYGPIPEVECLPSQLNQVFMNLLLNAAHAIGEERGRITVRTGLAGENVWLEFSDTGSGIPEEIRQKIFDPFFTTKPVGKGTGLGLSLSYGIIQNHDGRIEVESAAGKGSTFRIILPIKHQEAAIRKNESGMPAKHGQLAGSQ